jgi:hypothetical protein
MKSHLINLNNDVARARARERRARRASRKIAGDNYSAVKNPAWEVAFEHEERGK